MHAEPYVAPCASRAAAPTKDAMDGSSDPSMYASTSRVEMGRPNYGKVAVKVLPQERHTAGYTTAAVSSLNRVFGA